MQVSVWSIIAVPLAFFLILNVQAADVGSLQSEPIYRVKHETKVPVPMRDGVKLAAEIFRPDAPGKLPVLMLHRYFREGADRGAFFAPRGYVVALVDCRGRYDAGGKWVPYVNGPQDGYDAQQWLGRQPWSNGRIGTFGQSYNGFTQVMAVASSVLAEPGSRPFPLPGEWPTFRHDKSLGGRAQGVGHIVRPKIAWKHFVGRMEATLVVQPAGGSSQQAISTEEKSGPAEDVAWQRRWFPARPEAVIAGRLQPVPIDATTTYADVLPEAPGWERIKFTSGFNIPTVHGQWQDGPGTCSAFKDGRWQEVWRTENVPLCFAPYPIVGDFDADGRLEIAILPWNDLRIYDAKTGKLKDRCPFTHGRSYGFFGVYDLNGDGKKEFLVMADFAKHVDVLGYRHGKLAVLWQQNIEPDISDPQKILRVIPRPAADLDGDRVMEIVLNLFNASGDNRWHAVIRDGMTGKIKADLADEIVQGIADLDSSGRERLLTICTHGQGVPRFGTIRVRDLNRGRSEVLWEATDAAWTLHDEPPDLHTQNYATRGTQGVLVRNLGGHAAVILRRPSSPLPKRERGDSVALTAAVWDGRKFQPRMTISGANLEGLALDAAGAMLVRASLRPGKSSCVRLAGAKVQLVRCIRSGLAPGPVVVARSGSDKAPTIVAQGSGEELVALQALRNGGKIIERWRRTGRSEGGNWPTTLGAVIADLRGNGTRQVVFATRAPSGCARLVAVDLSGRPRWRHDFQRFPGDAPVWNLGGAIFWQAGHFTDPARQDVLVTLRRSMMHSDETFLLSGDDGKALWRRARQISSRGCGGQPFAVADYNGDGRDDAASLYPSIFYILDGPTGRDLIAKDCAWPGVPMRPVYWGQPVAVRLDGWRRPALVFTTGRRSMVGLARADGSLAWSDAYDRAADGFPAIGDFDGDGKLDILWIGFDEGSRCYDAASGKVLWKLPLGAGQNAGSAVSGDINADGRDEAVFVLGQTLYCIGTDGPGKPGRVLWTLDLPTRVSTPVIADATGEGSLSILLAGADGNVYCVE